MVLLRLSLTVNVDHEEICTYLCEYIQSHEKRQSVADLQLVVPMDCLPYEPRFFVRLDLDYLVRVEVHLVDYFECVILLIESIGQFLEAIQPDHCLSS